jgi:dihydrolipoamide dehydrogenase
MTDRYDVVVVGAGPAGYVAAIRAAQLGRTVACVNDWRTPAGEPALGGTCLNVGCIPSKALLESSELFARLKHDGATHGLSFTDLKLDLAAMMANKDKVVRELTGGIATLFKMHQITAIAGRGRLTSQTEIEVRAHDGATRVLQAGHIVLATGSSPTEIKAAPLTPGRIVDSTGALAFSAVPKRLAVIGAGVIGLELGSVWRRLGAEVILLEAQPLFLSIADEAVAKEALKQFKAQGLDIRLGARVLACQVEKDTVAVEYEDSAGKHREQVDQVLVCVGRRPNTKDLAAPETGLLFDEWGYIHVDEHCRTNLPTVYAVGDVVRGPMLAHKGMEEGVMAAECIAGLNGHVNYDAVPGVIYTLPEIAWVGKTEQQLKSAAIPYRAGQFSFSANGRARAMHEATGFIKLLAHAETDRVLGVHLIGPHVSELVASAVLALEFSASAEDLALTMFAHPTLSEALHEAALSVAGRAVHAFQARKQ